MDCRVSAFTDTYLPTVNGVTYTVKTWRDRWQANGGEMSVVFPRSNGYDPDAGEHPVRSLPFPFYSGYRLGLPTLPDELEAGDIVHAHTPFSLGLAALRYRSEDRPLVASFHTPCGEYTRYISPSAALAPPLSRISRRYERWFLDRADAVIAPTPTAATVLTEEIGVDGPIDIVPNGVDLDRFRPVPTHAFRERYDLPDGPLIGYTGRHGYEKRLDEIIEAVAAGPEDWSVVFGGEGPATPHLESLAASVDLDLTTLGFLDRDELPAFYAAVDVFAFPSPVETQGLVALESIACGTPVVAADAGALTETVTNGQTGYRYEPGDSNAFATALERALDEQSTLARRCLAERDALGVDEAMVALNAVYERVLDDR